MKCPVCGYDNPRDSQVCLNCGSSMEQEKLGKPIDDIAEEQTIMLGGPLTSVPLPVPKPEMQTTGGGALPPPPPPPRSHHTDPPPVMSQPAPPLPPSSIPDPPQGATDIPPGSMTGDLGMNNLALISLILGIVALIPWCCFGLFMGIASIICGIMALQQIKVSKETGYGLAVAGIILGSIGILMFIGWHIAGAVARMTH